MNGKMKRTLAAAAAVLMVISAAPAASAATFAMRAENKKSTSFSLKWNPIEGAEAYRVYEYDTATKKFTEIKTVKSELCKFEDLTPSTAYKYKVVALQKVDGKFTKFDESGVVTVKTPEKDPAPASSDNSKKEQEKTKIRSSNRNKTDNPRSDRSASAPALGKEELEQLKKDYNTAKSNLSKAQSALSTAEKTYNSAEAEYQKAATGGGHNAEAQEKMAKAKFKRDQAYDDMVDARTDVSTYQALVNSLKAQLVTQGIAV